MRSLGERTCRSSRAMMQWRPFERSKKRERSLPLSRIMQARRQDSQLVTWQSALRTAIVACLPRLTCSPPISRRWLLFLKRGYAGMERDVIPLDLQGGAKYLGAHGGFR